MNTTSRESISKTDERIDKLADQLSTLVKIVSKKVVTPAPIKTVEETCVTCGGAHSWYNCPTTDNNQASVCTTTGTYNQVAPSNRVSNQMAPPGFAPVKNNGQNRFNQNQGQGNNFNRGNNFHERETEETTDKEQINFQGIIAQIPPLVIPIQIPELDVPKTLHKTTPILEPDVPKKPPELELKDLPSHLEYAYLEENDKLPVIIAKDLKDDEKDALLKVLKSHKRAISSEIPTSRVIKKEVLKLLDAGMIYPISDSPWVSPVHCVPKKGGITVVANEENELNSNSLVTGGREKTTFTCPYGTFAYRRMPFGLCNAPGTFQRCMMAIFHDMIEKTMEVFMDDFSVFGDSFDSCLSNLEKMLKRCEDTNLVLNWEKCHFMCREGIVLGHKISKSGIEVDRAKVDVIAKLPHPTTVKGVRSFLGHAGLLKRSLPKLRFSVLVGTYLSKLCVMHSDFMIGNGF
ncbi:reverse transcriptase domain-containing protein [Tanacetum coccineum]